MEIRGLIPFSRVLVQMWTYSVTWEVRTHLLWDHNAASTSAVTPGGLLFKQSGKIFKCVSINSNQRISFIYLCNERIFSPEKQGFVHNI